MLILALDTSSPVGSIALRDDHSVIGLLTADVSMTHSEGLMPAVDLLFGHVRRSVEDLTAVACISGPGSYTGLRIGIATAQGLACARRLPCFSYTSLSVMAWALPHCAFPICPILPARKGWLYAQLFRWRNGAPAPFTPELYLQPAGLVPLIQEPSVLYGTGLAPHRDALAGMLGPLFLALPPACQNPRADLLAERAAEELHQGGGVEPERLLPFYLGPSQAEINWKNRRPASDPPS